MTANIKYVVNVPHVQEVSLYGSADWDFWREQLKPEGLTPRDNEGRAELLLIAALKPSVSPIASSIRAGARVSNRVWPG